MTINLAFSCLALLLLTLLLVGVSVGLLGLARKDKGGGVNGMTRVLLVCLRLAIGWHFVFEAADKLNNPNWSSAPYQRESVGPLAPYFRGLAGDRLVDQLTVGPDNAFPEALEADWRAYVDELKRFYELDAEQAERATDVFRQAKSNFATWASVTKQTIREMDVFRQAKGKFENWASVTKHSEKILENVPPPELTIPRRLEIHAELEQAVRMKEEEVPKKGKEGFKPLNTAKANLDKWRAELKDDLDFQTDLVLKKPLRELLVGFAKDDLPAEYRNKIGKTDIPELRQAVRKQFLAWDQTKTEADQNAPLLSRTQKTRDNILEPQSKDRENAVPDPLALEKKAVDKKGKEQKIPLLDLLDPLPPGVSVQKPLSEWSTLELSDWMVKYGLLAVGLCLLVGFLTRLACLGGAAYLLLFWLAMPPLPGWPDLPRTEGHYLFINKNIIEMLALLALATTRSGQWAGLDGLLQFLWPSRWRKTAEPVKLETSFPEPMKAGR